MLLIISKRNYRYINIYKCDIECNKWKKTIMNKIPRRFTMNISTYFKRNFVVLTLIVFALFLGLFVFIGPSVAEKSDAAYKIGSFFSPDFYAVVKFLELQLNHSLSLRIEHRIHAVSILFGDLFDVHRHCVLKGVTMSCRNTRMFGPC